MRKMLSDLTYLFPVMFYFLLEAIIVGTFITILWKIFLNNLWGLGYLQIVVIYWTIKMLFFDIFKLIGSFQPPPKQPETNPEVYNDQE